MWLLALSGPREQSEFGRFGSQSLVRAEEDFEDSAASQSFVKKERPPERVKQGLHSLPRGKTVNARARACRAFPALLRLVST